jgi:HTH-like domain
MRLIDELFTAWPFLGSRRMTAMLHGRGLRINRKRVQRLMRKMGIAALGPKPRTTKPVPGHKIYPYLLCNLTIERVNHVWMDVSICVAALGDALAKYGKPEIFNTDQGSQFTSASFTADGQRLHRARLAVAQARGYLSEGLRRRLRGQGRDRRLDRLLQRATPSPGARLSHAGGRLARGGNNSRRQPLRHDKSRKERSASK